MAIRETRFFDNDKLFKIALINYGVILIIIALYVFTRVKLLAFAPLISTAFVLFMAPLAAAPGIIITYITFDGMLKILSGHKTVIQRELLVLTGFVLGIQVMKQNSTYMGELNWQAHLH